VRAGLAGVMACSGPLGSSGLVAGPVVSTGSLGKPGACVAQPASSAVTRTKTSETMRKKEEVEGAEAAVVRECGVI
jgi:hypothetical protein